MSVVPLTPARPPFAASVVAVASFGAAAIHAALIGPHLTEYAPEAAFFAVVAVLQFAAGVVVLASPSRRNLLLVAGGSVALIVLWAISRTVGLPTGAERWTPEAIGTADILAAIFEAAAVGAASSPILRRRSGPGLAAIMLMAAAVTIAGILVGGLAHGDPLHAIHIAAILAATTAFSAYVAEDARRHGMPRFALRP